MVFNSRTFWLAKDARFADEYEDAFEVAQERGVAVVADGVSSALFSGQWARVLADAVAEDPPKRFDDEAFARWLGDLRAKWEASIDMAGLGWSQKKKLDEVGGAYTTVLWVQLVLENTEDDDRPEVIRCRSTAVGDCCLFHLREEELLYTFPIASADQFNAYPMALGSINQNRDHLLEFYVVENSCKSGDLLVLGTDAIALWAFEQFDAGNTAWLEEFWDMSQEAWTERILALRSSGQLRCDNTTLVMLRVA